MLKSVTIVLFSYVDGVCMKKQKDLLHAMHAFDLDGCSKNISCRVDRHTVLKKVQVLTASQCLMKIHKRSTQSFDSSTCQVGIPLATAIMGAKFGTHANDSTVSYGDSLLPLPLTPEVITLNSIYWFQKKQCSGISSP